MTIQKKEGWYTDFSLPSKYGRCNWWGCKNKPVKGGFCEECGKHVVSVINCDKIENKYN